jgi:hypothetical protein
MPIAMHCPGCETRFEFANDLEGKRIKCKTCGDVFRVERPVRKPRDDDGPRRARPRDDEDRPSGRHRRPAADLSDDEMPRRRDDDYEDDRPKKKKASPLLIVGLAAGLPLLVIAAVVAAILLSRGKSQPGTLEPADIVKAPAKTCPLEVPERSVGHLVLSDGNLFGLLRRTDNNAVRKTWVFEPYDLSAGRRVGRIELTGVEDPKAFTLSPDGRHLLITESRGIGWGGDHWITLWSVKDGKNLTPGKWTPFQRNERRPFDAPALYRAEFAGNERIIALGTNRVFYLYPLAKLDEVEQGSVGSRGDPLGKVWGPTPDNLHRLQYQVAFTSDRRRMAVWNGDGYSIVGTTDGVEIMRTPSVSHLAKEELWRNLPQPERVRGGAVAFSPDGKLLAGVITHDFGSRQHVLCLWETNESNRPAYYHIANNQFNDSTTLSWWGNRFVATGGSKVEGMLIDARTGLGKRQLMGPEYNHFGFGRDGRLWYAASPDRDDPATMYVVDAPDPEALTEPDDYEQIPDLGAEFFLRRLWMEPGGVTRKPVRLNPDLHRRLIRRP